MQRHGPEISIPLNARGAAIALGNFDGVHKGHQGVIESARAAAQLMGAPLAAAVFEPHPRRFFRPDAAPFRLQSSAQQTRAMAALGVAHLFEIGFDHALTQLSDRAFAEHVLSARLGVKHVSVGADFRFGPGRIGDVAALAHYGSELGFSVEEVAPVLDRSGTRISSSAIREALERGDVAAARERLTRPWAIAGVVERGVARGKDFGFPTANVALGDYIRPRLGVYAVRVDVGDGALHPGVASIGVNPTFVTLQEPLLEAHLFDFSGDLLGWMIEVQIVEFLRDEAKFASVEALKAQMKQDAIAARAALAKAG